jgi:nitrate reductase NapAB chaperone NapD
MDEMAMVGAFARIEPGTLDKVVERLEKIDGVSTFDLDDPGKVGLLIEAEDADSAHAKLTKEIRNTEDVWGVWPVYMENTV